MRFQGKITQWQDQKGFGFVSPNGGGERAFVHIHAFKRNRRRPLEGDLITYVAVKDSRGRLTASDIQYVGQPRRHINTETTWYGTGFALLFYLMLGSLVLLNKLKMEVLGLYTVASLILIIMYATDKRAAKSQATRISERALQILALLGGWPGGLIAQKMFRHKTKKTAFQRAFLGAVLVNIVLFALLFRYGMNPV